MSNSCVICEEGYQPILSIFVVGEISSDFRKRTEFPQFHNKLFLISLKSWLLVAVRIVRCCFDGNCVQESANRVCNSRSERGRLFAQHPNDKIGSFEVVRYD